MKMSLLLLLFLFLTISSINCEQIKTVVKTELFEIILDPPLFNWTYEGEPNQFAYQCSLRNTPDLPQWIKYVFSERHHAGILYGVPPNNLLKNQIQLQVVALNKKNYDTRIQYFNIHITEKLKPAKYEVHMKIDNLNVEDMFEMETMENLMNIFKKQLWKDVGNDLYVTFLESAIQLGARKPLDPNEGDGVVLRLGSRTFLSLELIELQEEVKPLWKVPSCPRDYKRTSVERFFRKAGFILDWCSFRLIDNSNSALKQSNNEELKSVDFDDRWKGIRKDQVPKRSYTWDFVITILLPMVCMIALSLVLSIILCFDHERIHDPMSEDFFNNLYHICTDHLGRSKMDECFQNIDQFTNIHRATESLRNLSTNRELSPDPSLVAKLTSSPNSTMNRGGVHCRPSPPPYVRPKYRSNF